MICGRSRTAAASEQDNSPYISLRNRHIYELMYTPQDSSGCVTTIA